MVGKSLLDPSEGSHITKRKHTKLYPAKLFEKKNLEITFQLEGGGNLNRQISK